MIRRWYDDDDTMVIRRYVRRVWICCVGSVVGFGFGRGSGGGGFGTLLPRQFHHEVQSTPGPGEYSSADVNAPTVDSNLGATKGRLSGGFASSSLRDTDDWIRR